MDPNVETDRTTSISRFVLVITLEFVAIEFLVWQALSPWPFWPFQSIELASPGVRSIIILITLGLAFTAILIQIRHGLLAPLRALACYIDTEKQLSLGEPGSTLASNDYLARLNSDVRQLIAELKAQKDALIKQALNDPLTGLGNRRLLDQSLDTLLPLSRRMATSVSALMIDVDHFKAYNDYYGHPAGDACLIEIANVLRDTFRRETDIIIRLGGEEFLVVLIDVYAEDALALAEAMRSMLHLVGITHAHSPTGDKVTVSIGVATAPVGTAIDPDTLIGCADECLYDCKLGGRNRSAHRFIGEAHEDLDVPEQAQNLADTLF